LRIIEYTGPREAVEDLVSKSVQGERTVVGRLGNNVIIKAATIGTYPEILESSNSNDINQEKA
jgi:hypothetical protein